MPADPDWRFWRGRRLTGAQTCRGLLLYGGVQYLRPGRTVKGALTFEEVSASDEAPFRPCSGSSTSSCGRFRKTRRSAGACSARCSVRGWLVDGRGSNKCLHPPGPRPASQLLGRRVRQGHVLPVLVAQSHAAATVPRRRDWGRQGFESEAAEVVARGAWDRGGWQSS